MQILVSWIRSFSRLRWPSHKCIYVKLCTLYTLLYVSHLNKAVLKIRFKLGIYHQENTNKN